MSVWEHISPSYRGETLRRLAELMTYETLTRYDGLWDYTLKPDAKLFPGMAKGHRLSLLRGGVNLEREFEFSMDDSAYLSGILAQRRNWIVGYKAVVSLSDDLIRGRYLTPCADESWKTKNILTNDVISYSIGCEAINKAAAFPLYDEASKIVHISPFLADLEREVGHIIHLSNLHSHVRRNRECLSEGPEFKKGHPLRKIRKWCAALKSSDMEINYLPKNLFAEESKFEVTELKGLFFWIPNFERKHGYILTMKDMMRVRLAINTYRNGKICAEFFKLQYKTLAYQRTHEMMWSELFEIASLGGNLNGFCEAWDQAYKTCLAKIAGPLSTQAYASLAATYHEKGYNRTLDLKTFQATVKDASLVVTLSCMNAHKALPAPDYDLPGAFSKELELHRGKNAYGGTEESDRFVSMFRKYLRLHAYKALQKRYGKAFGHVKPEYKETQFASKLEAAKRNNKSIRIRMDNIDMLDLRGTMLYKRRTEDFHFYFNDAAFTPSSLSKVRDLHKLPAEQKKLIPHMLKSETKFPVEQLRKELEDNKLSRELLWRAGMKNEAAKEDGRFYFIGEGAPKVLLQEMEENVGEFMKYVVGNAVGTRDSNVKEKLQAIAKQELDADTSKFYLSFDISKWSPHMSVALQRDTCEFFSELFNEKWVANLPLLFESGRCCLSTAGYFASYLLEGSNLEGMLGKTLTYAMVCAMGVCVLVLRQRNIMKEKDSVDLLAFLDDGLGSWVVSKKRYVQTCAYIIECVREVYKALSLELKPSKCYPSDRFFIFLNITYFGGARLFDHFKTFLKAGISKGQDIMSFPEQIREIGSWASGAAASGGDWVYVYTRYIYEVVRLTFKADPKYKLRGGEAFVQMFAPVPMQGYGVSTLPALVSNVSRHPFSEACSFLRLAASIHVNLRPIIATTLSRAARRKSGKSFLRAPATVTLMGRHLTETTLAVRIEQKIRSSVPSAYLRDILLLDRREFLDDLGMDLMNQRRPIALVMIKDLYSSMPDKILEDLLSKFKKSETVAAMFGDKFVKDVQKKYARDIIEVNRVFRLSIS